MLLSLTAIPLGAVLSGLTQRDKAALACTHPQLLASVGEWWAEADLVIEDQHSADAFLAWLDRVKPELKWLELFPAASLVNWDTGPSPSFYLTMPYFERVLRACPTLRKLAACVEMTDATIDIDHPNLEDLALATRGSSECVDMTGCPELRTLRMEGFANEDMIDFILCPPATHTMTLINFIDVDKIIAPGLVDARMHWIRDEQAMDPGRIGFDADTAKNLKTLRISESAFQWTGGTPTPMTSLETLELVDVDVGEFPDEWIAGLTSLKKLVFDSSSDHLPPLPKARLEYLKLVDGPNVAPGDLRGMGALQTLEIDRTPDHDFFPEVAGIKELIVMDTIFADNNWNVLSPALDTLVFKLAYYHGGHRHVLEAADWPRCHLGRVKNVTVQTSLEWVLDLIKGLDYPNHAVHYSVMTHKTDVLGRTIHVADFVAK